MWGSGGTATLFKLNHRLDGADGQQHALITVIIGTETVVPTEQEAGWA
jgi:hypothetical protein